MTEEPHRNPNAPSGSDAGQGLWQACVEQLAQDLPEQQFNTWIKPLVAQVAEDFSKVTLLVANRFKLDWIRAQYAGRIAALLEGLYGQPVTLELAIAQREAVLARLRERPDAQSVMVFDDHSGERVELDLRPAGNTDGPADAEHAPARGVGRPKLGVVARESLKLALSHVVEGYRRIVSEWSSASP